MFNFERALSQKANNQDRALDLEAFDATTRRIVALKPTPPSGGGTQTEPATPVATPTFAGVAGDSYTGALPSAPVVDGSRPMLPSVRDYLNNTKPFRFAKGTAYVSPYAAKPQKQEEQPSNGRAASFIARTFGGMLGNAVDAKTGRESRIDQEMKKQLGYMKGKTRVTDPNGSPTVDTVDAKLADGEAVLNAGAAELLGREKIATLNKKGLKVMGEPDAQPMMKHGRLHAYAGINFNDPEMINSAQNAEMRRRMAQGIRQPVANSALVQSAPIQATPVQPAPVQPAAVQPDPVQAAQAPKQMLAAKPAANGLTSFERAIISGKNPNNITLGRGGIGANGYASGVQRAAPAAVKQGIMGKIASGLLGKAAGGAGLLLQAGEAGAAANDADFAPGGRFRTAPATAATPTAPTAQPTTSMTPGDAMRLRRESPGAEPQYTTPGTPVPPPKPDEYSQFFNANGITDQMRANGAPGMTDMSNAGNKIYKQVDKNGKVTYTGMGAPDRIAAEKAAPEQALNRQALRDALSKGLNPFKDSAKKEDAYKVEMGEVAQALGTPALDDEGKPIADMMTGRQVVNRNPDAEKQFFKWMQQNGITDTNKGLAIYQAGVEKKPSSSGYQSYLDAYNKAAAAGNKQAMAELTALAREKGYAK